ncbi:hypothetical protein HQO42_14955 [Rhodococcus fascians]|nr:hypothetical protein [Rhodococcus fascians]MBY4237753.1 hypothetical protein [Rhodococcus fascians]MBY4253956.1 hypothetical protein [Rhodococcus fascians]MBY4269173.1 hypothetical protein [Rhodococcus fascians]
MPETNYAVAPGEYIEEWIEDNNRDAAWLAEQIGATPKYMADLLAGRSMMSLCTADSIGRATGIPGRIWMGYERQYRADVERLNADAPAGAECFCDL